MDELAITQVEQQVLVEPKAQEVFAHIQSLYYAIVVDVSLITPFVITIVIVATSQEEGDNGHTQTIA